MPARAQSRLGDHSLFSAVNNDTSPQDDGRPFPAAFSKCWIDGRRMEGTAGMEHRSVKMMGGWCVIQ